MPDIYSKKKRGRKPKLKNPVLMHGIMVEAEDKIALMKVAKMWDASTLDLIRLGIRIIVKRMQEAYEITEEDTVKK